MAEKAETLEIDVNTNGNMSGASASRTRTNSSSIFLCEFDVSISKKDSLTHLIFGTGSGWLYQLFNFAIKFCFPMYAVSGISLSIIQIYFELSTNGLKSQEFWDNVISLLFFLITAIIPLAAFTKFKKHPCACMLRKIEETLGNEIEGLRDHCWMKIRRYFGRILVITTILFDHSLNFVNHEHFVKNSGKPLQVININIAINAFSFLMGFYVIIVLIALVNTWHRFWRMFKKLNMYIERLKHPVELGELDKIKTYYRRTVHAAEQSDEGANIFYGGFCVLLFSGIIIKVRRVATDIQLSENKFIYNDYIGLLIAHIVLMTLTLIITMKYAADINSESKLCLKYVNILSAKVPVVERTIEFDREVKL
jgi:hypothetical protein